MSDGQDRGEGREGRGPFLSAHRCPEVDLLPHLNSETQIPPLSSLAPALKKPELTCNYLEVSTHRCDDVDDNASLSDWSDEDLSLHLPPSVILQSEDEESDPESSFECVDINMETPVKGQEGEVPKMVPKRQIHRKKKDNECIIKEATEKLQVNDGPPEGTAVGNKMPSSAVHHRPDVLLRQHSMPASLQASASDMDSYRVSKGLVAGANQGTGVGGNTKQRLQKSFSLDETKTKMASCIIKSVLYKKMQAELNNSKTSHQQSRPAALPRILQPGDQQKGREGREGDTGGLKAPVHVVRDVRSLVKNTNSLPFATTHHNNKPTSLKVIGQKESPPPTYQQAVGSNRVVSLSQSQHSARSNRSSRPTTQQRRGSETVMKRSKDNDVTPPVMLLAPPTSLPISSEPSKVSRQEVTPTTTCVSESTPKSRHRERAQPALSAQEQSSIPSVPPQFAPCSSQQFLHPCFYTPAALPAFSSTLASHLAEASYMHGPLSYIQTLPAAPVFRLLTTSQENKSRLTGNGSDQQDQNPADQTRTTEDQKDKVNAATRQQLPDHKVTSSAAPPATLGKPPLHHITDATPVQFFYVDTPPQSQRKMLLDPETGQYVQVFLPTSSSTNSCMFPVSFANPAHLPASMMNPAPAVLSVMQIQPTVTVSSLYGPPFQPIPLHSPAVNFTNTQ